MVLLIKSNRLPCIELCDASVKCWYVAEIPVRAQIGHIVGETLYLWWVTDTQWIAHPERPPECQLIPRDDYNLKHPKNPQPFQVPEVCVLGSC